jgi:hypothetical protein
VDRVVQPGRIFPALFEGRKRRDSTVKSSRRLSNRAIFGRDRARSCAHCIVCILRDAYWARMGLGGFPCPNQLAPPHCGTAWHAWLPPAHRSRAAHRRARLPPAGARICHHAIEPCPRACTALSARCTQHAHTNPRHGTTKRRRRFLHRTDTSTHMRACQGRWAAHTLAGGVGPAIRPQV